jgi:4,5-dihydroxyphthalate decarboxylase
MHTMKLRLGTIYSDRTAAMFGGLVQASGYDLEVSTRPPLDLIAAMIQGRDFEAGEMSLATYLIRAARGHRDLIAIPIFPLHMFLHSSVYVRNELDISSPEELNGRNIGIPEFQMAPGVWIRSILRRRGFDTESVHWFTGGLERPGGVERIPLPANRANVTALGSERS